MGCRSRRNDSFFLFFYLIILHKKYGVKLYVEKLIAYISREIEKKI